MKFPTEKTKHRVSINLFEQHLAQSLDELQRALESKQIHSHEDFLLEWRSASTSILHGFCAIDSLVNYLAYEYFENCHSSWYIEPENREFVTEKHLSKWPGKRFEERLNIIWKERKFNPIPQDIFNKIVELKNLRNWVSHGNPYTIIIEHEFIQVDDNTVRGIIHDTYADPNQNKFVSEEFKSPAYLDKNDARKAMLIVLEVTLFILREVKWFSPIIKTFYGGPKEYRISSYSNLDSLLVSFSVNKEEK